MLMLKAKENLKSIRSEQYSQREFIELLSIALGREKTYSRSFYARIETGSKPVNQNIAVAIARILQKPVTEVFAANKELTNE